MRVVRTAAAVMDLLPRGATPRDPPAPCGWFAPRQPLWIIPVFPAGIGGLPRSAPAQPVPIANTWMMPLSAVGSVTLATVLPACSAALVAKTYVVTT